MQERSGRAAGGRNGERLCQKSSLCRYHCPRTLAHNSESGGFSLVPTSGILNAIYFFMLEMGCCCVAQAGLEFLDSSNPCASASRVAGITVWATTPPTSFLNFYRNFSIQFVTWLFLNCSVVVFLNRFMYYFFNKTEISSNSWYHKITM